MSPVLSASLEDYLKAIFRIVAVKQAARAKDISARLGVSNSSVTGALRTLADRGLINYAPYDVITLTPLGQTTARDIVRRQEALREFFTKVLAVDAETAEIGACKMEHEIPPAIVERFIQFVDFVEVCPRAGAKWIHGFGYSCRDVSREGCAECVRSCLTEIEGKHREEPGKGKDDSQSAEDRPAREAGADCGQGRVAQTAGRYGVGSGRGGGRGTGCSARRPDRDQAARLSSFIAQGRGRFDHGGDAGSGDRMMAGEGVNGGRE